MEKETWLVAGDIYFLNLCGLPSGLSLRAEGSVEDCVLCEI